MSEATFFDETFYLSENSDIAIALEMGGFRSALEHFNLFGGKELRSPNPIFQSSFYALQNPDVVAAVEEGFYNSVFHHYQLYGEEENRLPSSLFIGFDSSFYLEANPDVASAVANNLFISALDHYIRFGQAEQRLGLIFEPGLFTLTEGRDIFLGTLGDDQFVADVGTLQTEDVIQGGQGTDVLEATFSIRTPVLPSATNLSGVESISVIANEHGSVDFSIYPDLIEIKMSGGHTVDHVVKTPNIINLAQGQSLHLANIKDGDDVNESIDDGGIRIIQDDTASFLELTLDNIGPDHSIPSQNLFIDIAGTNVTDVAIKVLEKSIFNLKNSSNSINTLNLTGSGTLVIDDPLSDSIARVDGTGLTANLTMTVGGEGATVIGSSGPNSIILTGGINDLTGGISADLISVRDGSANIKTGSGNDIVQVLNGETINIETGIDNDEIRIFGGTNSLDMGSGSDFVQINDGVNTVLLGSGKDAISLNGGSNTLFGASDTKVINITGGFNNVASGIGIDVINIAGGNNTVFSEGSNDSIVVLGGVNRVFTGQGNDLVTIGGAATFEVLDGGAGDDSILVSPGSGFIIPAAVNFERYLVQKSVHQSLDFSQSLNISEVKLQGGTTIDGDTITITVGAGQTLVLDGLTDGDTGAALLSDGGITIAQDNSVTAVGVTLMDVGPATSIANENIFIDIAGTGTATLTVTSGNDSFVVFSNSGGALTGLELLGTGTMALGTLPNSITNVNGAAASANLTLTIGSGASNTIRGGIGDDAITLSGGVNDVDLGDGDDTLTTSSNLVAGDRIDGGNGTDTLEVIHTGLATIPSTANLTSIERVTIQDTVHQSLDFSALTSITGIELDSGTTVDGAIITTTIGANQELTLDSITDGDTAAASLADGGIKIAQANSITSIDLTVDDIGPASSNANSNVFIDFAGAGVATANITSANTSFIVFENSGSSLGTLNLSGSGTLGIQGALPNSVTTINGTNSSANLTLTSGTGDDTITGGSGNDTITLTGGTNNVTGGNGNDIINLSSGNDTVNSGNNDDQVNASAGSNTINTGSGADEVNLSGGTNGVTTSSGNDEVNITGGTNNVNTGNNNDEVNASAGSNTIDTGSGRDEVNLTGGTNGVDTGSGVDQITISNGTNNVTAGSNNDIINISNGTNTINTDSGSDQVTVTGGTNTVNTGSDSDTVTLGGVDTVDTGSGNDTVEAGATLTTADTIDGGDGTDMIASTLAITDALAARLSNFEILDIKGGGGITHDVSDLTGLTSLEVSAALSGNITITDLAAAAEIDISAAITNDLTINQINSAGGGDTLTFDFRGGAYTTGGSVIAPNIETVTINNNQSGNKVITGATFTAATNVTINATSADITINDLNALNIDTLDLSGSNQEVSITTGADTFGQAFTFTGGSNEDVLNIDGAILTAGTVYVVGDDQDTLILNADAVANVIRTSATNSINAFSTQDDATTANTPGFTTGSDTFDYNGSLSHDTTTSIVIATGASLQAAVASDADATVYVVVDPDGDVNFESDLDLFADGVSNSRADTLETRAQNSGLLSYSGLDAAFSNSEAVLIAIDLQTNEDVNTANNSGTAVFRFTNTDTGSVDTVSSGELELIGVFQDVSLGVADFI